MTTSDEDEPKLGEFVVRMALLISLVALATDAMLPALADIGADLGVAQVNDNQLVISSLFLGLAAGQIVYGPLSDSVGRKPAIYLGLALFLIGCLMSIVSSNFETMLAGRFLQGLGVAGPRIVSVAVVRDQYEGRAMARIMSLIMMTFIIVPAIAPALGQGVLYLADWRMIFVMLLVLGVLSLLWFGIRQEETLAPSARRPFSFGILAEGVKETISNRIVLGYSIASGLVFGPFIAYLASAQQILQQQYGLGDMFAFYFGVLALAVGAASFFNSKLVMRLGMRHLSWRALQALGVLSVAYLTIAYGFDGAPPFWTFMIWGLGAFFCIGLLFANFNAMAMEPLGHIAGIAAAVIGCFNMTISLITGTYIGQLYDGTVLPLVGGFAALGISALLVMYWTERETQVA